MIKELEQIRDSGDIVSFVIGGAPNNPINGRVVQVTQDRLIIEIEVGLEKYRYLMHPDNAVIVEKVK